MTTSIGIIGARGHVGAELIRLIAGHPSLELAFVGSRELAGQALPDHATLTYEALDAEAAANRGVDALILALPNGAAANYVAAIERTAPKTLIIDLSADYRFDDGWYYGLPELTRDLYAGQKRISNPGCYATAMQLAIAPMRDLLNGPVQCFGVSGYSGAGTTPSERNDPQSLRDNLMPYALVGHLHEREATRQLGVAIEFMPHVAPHFRGISMTVNMHLTGTCPLGDVIALYQSRYAGEALIRIGESAPWVSQNAGRHHVALGGFSMDDSATRLVVVSTLDNLLKGAATQAVQNINLAFGFEQLAGIPHD